MGAFPLPKGRSGFEIKPLGPITLGKDGRDAEGALPKEKENENIK